MALKLLGFGANLQPLAIFMVQTCTPGVLLYAVKVQRSLAPLSRFRGSHILTAHEQHCCRFQNYANSVRSPMKFTLREPHSWDP